MTTDARSFSNLEDYLEFLLERGSICEAEHTTMRAALAPLLVRYPDLCTIEEVRRNISEAGSVDALQRDESARWQSCSQIPGFDLKPALDLFFVTKSSDPERVVVGFTPEIDAALADLRYVPPSLKDGHLFFWIILRMCRRQHEIDRGAPPT